MLSEPTTGDARKSIATLEDYLSAVRKNKWLVLTTAAGLLALAVLYTSSRSDRYEATSRVVVEPTPAPSKICDFPQTSEECRHFQPR